MGSDMGDMWREHRKDMQAVRASRREADTEFLRRNKIAFESKNGGAHLIVTAGKAVADFWPGTGRWQIRNGVAGTRVLPMLRAMEREASRG